MRPWPGAAQLDRGLMIPSRWNRSPIGKVSCRSDHGHESVCTRFPSRDSDTGFKDADRRLVAITASLVGRGSIERCRPPWPAPWGAG